MTESELQALVTWVRGALVIPPVAPPVVVPPVVVPPIQTGASSPDNTESASTITDAEGHIWTIADPMVGDLRILRDGVETGGRAQWLLWYGDHVYADNNAWYRWTGTAWTEFDPSTEVDMRPFSRARRGRISPQPISTDLTSLPLVQQGTLVYQGGFYGPEWNRQVDGGSIGYGGFAMGFNPANNSLFIQSNENDWPVRVAEMTIPALTSDLLTMNRATYIQSYNQDIFDGTIFGDRIGGLYVHNGRLILTSRVYYDANNSGNTFGKAHYFRPTLNLSTTGVTQGPLRVASARQGYISGYMGPVPPEWQSALGGPAFTGWSCGPSIVGRTSAGPAVSTFDPDQLGVTDPVSCTDLVYYDDQTTATLGHWGTQPNPWPRVAGQGENHLYNGTAEVHGVAMPPSSRSVLFFGTIGYGSFCYGHKYTDPAKMGTDEPDGQHNCMLVDPADYTSQLSYYSINPTTGQMAPFYYQVWAYDALDLAAVKAGTTQPWEVVPYAYWTLNAPGMELTIAGRSVTFDLATGRIFFLQQRGETPIIHVYKFVP